MVWVFILHVLGYIYYKACSRGDGKMATSTINRNIKLNQVELRQIKDSKPHTVIKTNTKTLSAKSVLQRIRKDG